MIKLETVYIFSDPDCASRKHQMSSRTKFVSFQISVKFLGVYRH